MTQYGNIHYNYNNYSRCNIELDILYYSYLLCTITIAALLPRLPLHQRRRRHQSPRYFPPAASPPAPSSSSPQFSIAALLSSGYLSTSAVVVSTVLLLSHPLPSPSSSPRFTNATLVSSASGAVSICEEREEMRTVN